MGLEYLCYEVWYTSAMGFGIPLLRVRCTSAMGFSLPLLWGPATRGQAFWYGLLCLISSMRPRAPGQNEMDSNGFKPVFCSRGDIYRCSNGLKWIQKGSSGLKWVQMGSKWVKVGSDPSPGTIWTHFEPALNLLWTHLNPLQSIWTLLNPPQSIWTSINVSAAAKNMFESIWVHLIFGPAP